jgi:RNase P subunit RPR2
MPREVSTRQKKRKFRGNQFQLAKNSRVDKNNKTASNQPSTPNSRSSDSGNLSASARKIGTRDSQVTKEQSSQPTGYRLVDIEILSEVFQHMVCKECGGGSSLILEDKVAERKGSASHLRVRCQHCGIAIRGNFGDLSGMRSAIHASLFHCVSSEKRNLHNHCPDGADSWCSFKRDKANGTKLHKTGPGLPDNIIALIKPIYARLKIRTNR